MNYLKESTGFLLLSIHVQPRASKSRLVGTHGDKLKVAIQSPPVDDAANEAVAALFAKLFGVACRQVEIVRGSHSRQKTLAIRGVSLAEALAAIRREIG